VARGLEYLTFGTQKRLREREDLAPEDPLETVMPVPPSPHGSPGAGPLNATLWAALASVLLAVACASDDETAAVPPVDVRVHEVATRDVPITRERAAQTYGIQDVEIRARVRGFLTSTDYLEGGEVRRGALLFTIDPLEYEAQVAQAAAEVAAADAEFARANADVERLRPLAERNAVSRQDLDNAVALAEAAEARAAAQRALLRLAELNLSYTRVTSPITGTAGIANVDVGSLVVSSPEPTLLTVVSQVDTIRVRFRISEQEYLLLARALAVQDSAAPRGQAELELVLSDGTVHGHAGRVTTIDRNVDPTTGTIGVEALFPNPEELLRPGQFGRVRAAITTQAGAVVVPQRAVRELQGTYTVGVVLPDSTVETRTVVAGERSGSDWVITEGLAAGERIVLEGVERLRPGTKVRAVPATDG